MGSPLGISLQQTRIQRPSEAVVGMSRGHNVSRRKGIIGQGVDYIMDLIQKRQFLDSLFTSLSPPTTLLSLLNIHLSSVPEEPQVPFIFLSSLLILSLGIPNHVFQPLFAGPRVRFLCRRAESWFDCRSGRHISVSNDGPYPRRSMAYSAPLTLPRHRCSSPTARRFTFLTRPRVTPFG